jgi:hypothetical protein
MYSGGTKDSDPQTTRHLRTTNDPNQTTDTEEESSTQETTKRKPIDHTGRDTTTQTDKE